MRNKYMILALLPVLFQGTLYCEDQFKDIDQMIMPQLQSAQTLMKSSTIPLELQPILDALVSFAKRDKDKANDAVNQMKAIKAALAKYRTEEYKTTWDNICWFFGSNPKKVVDEIDPAITKVNNALNTLNTNSSKLGYTIAANAAAAVAIAGIAAAALWYFTPTQNESQNESQDYTPKNSHCDMLAIENAYATLGLNIQTATPAAAKSAYKRLALKLHPDKGGDQEEFKKVSNANDLIQECVIS